MTISTVVTAEHNGWAVWLRQDEDVRLIAHGIPSLGVVNEQALALAKEIKAGNTEVKIVRIG